MFEFGLSEWTTFIMWFLVAGIFIFIAKSISSSSLSRFLIPAFLLKIIGGLAFALVYNYYYKGGDTSYYFLGSNTLTDILFESPNTFFKLLFSTTDQSLFILHQMSKSIVYAHSAEEWFMVRLIFPINLLGLKSFLGTTFFMSILSLIGSWKFFKLMNKIIPNREITIFMISFLVPSVLFWGGGIMKDTVTLFCFSYIISLFYEFLYERKLSFFRVIFMIILMYIIYKLKAYILICCFPWFFLTLFLVFLNRTQSTFLKLLLIPFLLITIAIAGSLISSFVIESSGEYNSGRFFKNMQGFHDWNTYLGGSAYSLGDMEYSITGIILKAPQAINVTLFRPYFWEAGSVFIYLNALESFILLVLTIIVFVKTKFRPFKILRSSPYLLGGLVFCLLFSFAIGLTAYNFGALARFKIPVMGLYLFILLYIYDNAKPEIDENIQISE